MDGIERLIEALGDGSYGVREEAAAALVKIGVPAVEPLCQALREGNWFVRRRAARVLGKIGDLRAVEPLCFALVDGTADLRSAAAEALGDMGKETLPGLRARLHPTTGEQNETVRVAVRAAIEKIEKARAAPTRPPMPAEASTVDTARRPRTVENTPASEAA